MAGNGSAAKTDTVAVRSHDPTRLYLSEIGVSPLLTADEEKKFARLAQGGGGDVGAPAVGDQVDLLHLGVARDLLQDDDDAATG